MFDLDPRLKESTAEVGNLKLCHVRLMNDRAVPWLLLVPRREDIQEIYQLEKKDRALMIEEITEASTMLDRLYRPHKINVGALGNLVSQLHIHVICRFEQDRAWPNSIWNTTPIQPYAADELETIVATLQKGMKVSR